MSKKEMMSMDGNMAAAYVACLLKLLQFIQLHHHLQSELVDEWQLMIKISGDVVKVAELQSEAGSWCSTWLLSEWCTYHYFYSFKVFANDS